MVLLRTILFAAVTHAASAAATLADAVPLNANSTEVTTRHLQTKTIFQMCGVDIVGGDVTTVKNTNPDGCAFYVPGIQDAATWTDHEGGTCWIKKRGNGFPPVTPKVGAVSFFNQEGTWSTSFAHGAHNGYDMPGFDIGSVPGPTMDACVIACVKNPKCFAVTRSTHDGNKCWLKSRASAPVPKAGAISFTMARIAVDFGACPRV